MKYLCVVLALALPTLSCANDEEDTVYLTHGLIHQSSPTAGGGTLRLKQGRPVILYRTKTGKTASATLLAPYANRVMLQLTTSGRTRCTQRFIFGYDRGRSIPGHPLLGWIKVSKTAPEYLARPPLKSKKKTHRGRGKHWGKMNRKLQYLAIHRPGTLQLQTLGWLLTHKVKLKTRVPDNL